MCVLQFTLHVLPKVHNSLYSCDYYSIFQNQGSSRDLVLWGGGGVGWEVNCSWKLFWLAHTHFSYLNHTYHNCSAKHYWEVAL